MDKMMAHVLSLLLTLCLSGPALAQRGTANRIHLIASTNTRGPITQIDLPTPKLVQETETKADALFKEGKWQQAADSYELLAKRSNELAGLIDAAIQPYYKIPPVDQIGF